MRDDDQTEEGTEGSVEQGKKPRIKLTRRISSAFQSVCGDAGRFLVRAPTNLLVDSFNAMNGRSGARKLLAKAASEDSFIDQAELRETLEKNMPTTRIATSATTGVLGALLVTNLAAWPILTPFMLYYGVKAMTAWRNPKKSATYNSGIIAKNYMRKKARLVAREEKRKAKKQQRLENRKNRLLGPTS